MINRFRIVFLFIISSFTLNAQTLTPRVCLALSTGTNTVEGYFNNDADIKFKFGVLAGVSTEIPLSDRIRLEAGLFYLQSGRYSYITLVDTSPCHDSYGYIDFMTQ